MDSPDSPSRAATSEDWKIARSLFGEEYFRFLLAHDIAKKLGGKLRAARVAEGLKIDPKTARAWLMALGEEPEPDDPQPEKPTRRRRKLRDLGGLIGFAFSATILLSELYDAWQ
jgi:hypothetical protein